MNLSKVMSKSPKLAAILVKVAAILDFQMFSYLDLTKHFCANYHASAAIINYLNIYKKNTHPHLFSIL